MFINYSQNLLPRSEANLKVHPQKVSHCEAESALNDEMHPLTIPNLLPSRKANHKVLPLNKVNDMFFRQSVKNVMPVHLLFLDELWT